MPDPNIEVLKKESYLRMLENSPFSRIFNSLIVQYKDSKEIRDVLNDGEYSCAFFVSSVLVLHGLMDKTHATVKTVRQKIQEGGWGKTHSPFEPGDVLFWDEIQHADGSKSEHVGFALSNDEAVSTDFINKQVSRHAIDFGKDADGNPKRRVLEAYRYHEWNK